MESYSLPQDDPFKRVILTSFGLTPVKSHFNPLNTVILTTHGVISKWLLKELECKLTPQKCRFTLIWSHFDSSLASKCHFDPTLDSKRLLKSKRHIKEVKNDSPNNSVEMVKTTLLNLQWMADGVATKGTPGGMDGGSQSLHSCIKLTNSRSICLSVSIQQGLSLLDSLCPEMSLWDCRLEDRILRVDRRLPDRILSMEVLVAHWERDGMMA